RRGAIRVQIRPLDLNLDITLNLPDHQLLEQLRNAHGEHVGDNVQHLLQCGFVRVDADGDVCGEEGESRPASGGNGDGFFLRDGKDAARDAGGQGRDGGERKVGCAIAVAGAALHAELTFLAGDEEGVECGAGGYLLLNLLAQRGHEGQDRIGIDDDLDVVCPGDVLQLREVAAGGEHPRAQVHVNPKQKACADDLERNVAEGAAAERSQGAEVHDGDLDVAERVLKEGEQEIGRASCR